MCSVKISQPGIIIELVENIQRIAWLFLLSNSILQYFKIIILVCMVPNFHQILCRMAERRALTTFLCLACRKAHFIVWTSLWAIQKGNCRALEVEILYFFSWWVVHDAEQHWRVKTNKALGYFWWISMLIAFWASVQFTTLFCLLLKEASNLIKNDKKKPLCLAEQQKCHGWMTSLRYF